jgi:hypothetical protein
LVPGAKALRAFLTALLLILCACEQEPTPLPSVLPTNVPPTPTVDAAATSVPLRYAVAPGVPFFLTDADRSLISASAEIISLDAPPTDSDLGTLYDVIVSFNELSGGIVVPAPLQVNLLIDTTRPPLNDAALAALIPQIVDSDMAKMDRGLVFSTPAPSPTRVIPAILEALANVGYPDGFDLTLSSPFAYETEVLTKWLAVYGIEVRLVAAGEPAHHNVTNLPTPPSPNVITLYAFPISYRAVAGLNITFTPSGFPIASR